MVRHWCSADALLALPETGSPDEVLDTLLDGWDDDYGRGRALLLSRLRSLRRGRKPSAVRPTADVVYRALITFGEETGDMRFVHLAVESRDALVHGL